MMPTTIDFMTSQSSIKRAQRSRKDQQVVVVGIFKLANTLLFIFSQHDGDYADKVYFSFPLFLLVLKYCSVMGDDVPLCGIFPLTGTTAELYIQSINAKVGWIPFIAIPTPIKNDGDKTMFKMHIRYADCRSAIDETFHPHSAAHTISWYKNCIRKLSC
jgi:hypothetical protein